jgi:peptide/nickel transport system substrate-binding protein
VEQIGYGFDLNQAKALMKEAGYTLGSGGILEKDGKPLKVTMKALDYEPYSKVAQIAKEQLKELGMDVDIQIQPRPETLADASAGKYDLIVMMIPGAVPDARASLTTFFHSARVGTTNMLQVKDPQLDALLDAALKATDTAKGMEYAAQAQKLAVEKAYCVPLYQPKRFVAVSNRVKGLVINAKTGYPYLQLQIGYIEGGK